MDFKICLRHALSGIWGLLHTRSNFPDFTFCKERFKHLKRQTPLLKSLLKTGAEGLSAEEDARSLSPSFGRRDRLKRKRYVKGALESKELLRFKSFKFSGFILRCFRISN